MTKHTIAFLSLFTSFGTLFCCALPALFVILGAGATFAGLTDAFPLLIWLGVNKNIVFVFAGFFLALGLMLPIIFPPKLACDLNGNPCEITRSWSQPVLYISTLLYAVGGFFAYAAPYVL